MSKSQKQIENARKADKVLVAEQQNLRQQQEVEQSAQAIAKMTETLANDQEMFESLKTQLQEVEAKQKRGLNGGSDKSAWYGYFVVTHR